MQGTQTCDFLIIGGGILGVSVARQLKAEFTDAKICLVEKEAQFGEHASGRNSGVIHAGFYYSADSLKAKLTRDGNRMLTAWCEENGIPLNRCGKLVVARSSADLPQLDELARRGAANGVELRMISAKEAREIEPRVKTFERALYSPTTSTANPQLVLETMVADAKKRGISIASKAPYLRRDQGDIITPEQRFSPGYVINAAGLYADRIARDFGFARHYDILPFKGLYLYSDEPAGAFRTNIYPVPDLRNPFLGVHFTVTVDGHAKIGPTAIPAFWREQYAGWSRFRFEEFLTICARELGLMLFAGFDFKRLAFEEIMKYSRRRLVTLAGELAEGVRVADYRRWGRPGIRAQLMDTRTRKLEMDFVLEGDRSSLHILNAVSPGWTCALSFAQYVVSKIRELTS